MLRRPLRYTVPPVPGTDAKSKLVAADFSNAVTATGRLAHQAVPVAVRTPGLKLNDAQLAGLAQQLQTLPALGTRGLLSASVSASPLDSATARLTDIIQAAPVSPPAAPIDAYQIGTSPGLKIRNGPDTMVADPLQEKVVTGGGALNSALALP